ncbi:MAG: antibiotic biosynthesis monooxygenase [Deltaproteobacteria bacterium HGW-Deltaproteobacteria-15]|jgi:quinol monooxygenase YgiN|nr:MAG: antibiotic biosynthesis monooxygenase [Deltaproteobacteria bacterium HGW-Deltaproteobacteria-15]
MIISTVRIAVRPKMKEEILAILFSVKGPTESNLQCISCRIYTEPRNDKLITYEEVWQNEESLYQHLRSPHYRNLLAAMDLSSEPPEVKFTTVLKSEGMELMQRVLGHVDLKAMGKKKVRIHSGWDSHHKEEGGNRNDIS